MEFAAVAIEVAKRNQKEILHYLIPDHLKGLVKKGCRVLVPVGKQIKEGFVIDLPLSTSIGNLKNIKELIDREPIITEEQLELALWVQKTYLSPLYKVFEYVIPPYARTQVVQWAKLLIPLAELQPLVILDPELKILVEELGQGPKKVITLKRKFGNNIDRLLKDLKERRLIEIFSDYEAKGHTKYITTIMASITKSQLPQVLQNLKNAKKQYQILTHLVEHGSSKATDLCNTLGTNMATINSLENKGLIKKQLIEEHRTPSLDQEFKNNAQLVLNPYQANSVEEISKSMEQNKQETFLLHGVTGSGKTEVYLKAITKALALGKGALVLVPEISLTPQTIGRFSSVLKEKIVVIHSGLSQGERLDAWNDLIRGKAKVAVGVRSAVFAPVKDLGLIIIDEEHETTFKQSEPDPRYHAREVALQRAKLNQGVVVLGSATPSIESYYRSQQGAYRLLELPQRALAQELPQASIIDLREEFFEGNRSIFSKALKHHIDSALEKKEQVILFLNRRGYATFILCRECGQAMECKNCAIALTYHSYSTEIKCHYCSYTRSLPKRCPHCGSSFIRYFGAGTQQVEEEIRKIWPQVQVDRLDVDTTSNKDSHQRILAKFSRGDTQILIGTQMVTKGLDFPQVTLVGIIAADMALNLPDYSASEKTFQLITQVAGRAGRGAKKGRVVIQTYNPDHYAIISGKEQDYKNFYSQELKVRQLLGYPPFSVLVRVLLSGTKEEEVKNGAHIFNAGLQAHYKTDIEVLGPAPAPISKIKNRYRWQIILRGKNLDLLRAAAQRTLETMSNLQSDKTLRIVIDVEPQSIL